MNQSTIAAQIQAAECVSIARRLALVNTPENIDITMVPAYEKDYLKLIARIMGQGKVKSTRTGSLSLSLSAQQLDINISGRYVPLLYSKKVHHETFLKENRWFFSGSTDIKSLKADGVHIWDSWVTPETAVFEQLPVEGDRFATQKGRDVESWIRCKIPQVWPILVQYKRDNKIGTLNDQQATEFKYWFTDTYKNPDIPHSALNQLKHEVRMMPVMRLVSGDIGSGAYGASWRNIQDTRVVNHIHRADELKARGFDVSGDDWKATRKIDQLAKVIHGLQNDPDGRRHIMSAWNIPLIDETVLPACHSFVQFISEPNYGGKRSLTCMLHQRSH